MEINFINLFSIISLCALTAFLSHMGMAVFHDGIRPVIPEHLEGRMNRPELASIAFGLSVGFIASVGIGNTLATNLLNPWLLFLATDIIGIVAPNKWFALAGGGLWGILCLTGLSTLNTALTGLPIDLIGAIGVLGNFVVTGFSLFPIVSIIMQFGFKTGLISSIFVLLARILGPMVTTISADSWTMLVGILILIGLCIHADIKNKSKDVSEDNVFTERIARIKKNLPYLMIAGALIALVSNIHLFAGSTVSMFDLSKAYASGNLADAQKLIKTAATNEFMRGLSFIPLIATTAVTTGVYGVAGFTFVYIIGYLSPNPIIAVIGGALMIVIEVVLLGGIGKFLGKFPSIRDASDNIRSSMNDTVEFALLIGSVNAATNMGAATKFGAAGGFMIVALVYLINEVTGRKIMKMAVGPIGAIATGVVLNILHLVGLIGLA
ncbi:MULTISPECIES: YhfT family protein [Terrabacteria group]|uniref:YhfT family protein n=1 Tax=Bacillati TaxID=1783272 RepID=UPI001C6F17D1|nr:MULTISPECIES: YhfT family protein [Terrabacteria group]MBW9212985.1 YhfT family protein [Trueperella sp. zg.1013]